MLNSFILHTYQEIILEQHKKKGNFQVQSLFIKSKKFYTQTVFQLRRHSFNLFRKLLNHSHISPETLQYTKHTNESN